jgi:hypothetical protein
MPARRLLLAASSTTSTPVPKYTQAAAIAPLCLCILQQGALLLLANKIERIVKHKQQHYQPTRKDG